MPTKTLEELRAEARTRGLTGYSRLTKAQLRALLDNSGKRVTPTAAKRAAKPPRKTAARTPAKKKSMRAARGGAHPEPTTTLMPRRENAAGAEESIEAAKYALTTAGMTPGGRRLTDLLEDIDRLPTRAQPATPACCRRSPACCTPTGRCPRAPTSRARVCGCAGLTRRRSRSSRSCTSRRAWTLVLPRARRRGAGAYCVHLGRYDAHGNFVSSFERAIARLPTLYAEARPDRQWWSKRGALPRHVPARRRRHPATALAGPARSAAASPRAWRPKAISRSFCTRTCRSCAIRSTTVSRGGLWFLRR